MTGAYALTMAEKILHKHGVTGWRVVLVDEFPDHPKRFGLCSQRTRTITLAERWLADDREAWETIYHEIAHALVPDDVLHGSRWYAMFRRIAFGL